MGVSGNSYVGKSYQMFTISEELLAKVTEAVQAGEKSARSSGNINSFEVFYRGFRANICIGRIYVIPASICSDRKDFPTALLYGCLVKEFGGEEIGDMIEKKIGESEFDEYSQADFDTIKEKLFGVGDGKFESLILFAPTWVSKREYIAFKFTKDEAQLKNNLRHQVFAAYFDPRLSSAFNAIMTNADTTKLDVTDITPKLNFPFLAESLLTQYPELQKQAGNKKKIFLNHRTADAVTKEVLDPQELDVFESLNQALSEALVPDTESVEEAGEEHHDEGGFDVPRVAAVVHCTSCGNMIESKKPEKCEYCGGKAKVKGGKKGSAAKDADAVVSDKEAASYDMMRGLAESRESEKSTEGHKPGCGCDFCKNKSTLGKKNKEDAPKTGAAGKKCKTCHAILMGDEARGGRCNKCLDRAVKSKAACLEPAAHETPITNVGPGTEAADAQEGMVKAVKENVELQAGEPPVGIAIDENGVPRSKAEEAKVGSKKTSAIEDETAILPTVIADSVIHEVVQFFVTKGLQDPIGENTEPVVDYLTNYAERVYAANTNFRKKVRTRGNSGRDMLYAFMRHWMAGWLYDHNQGAFRQLPHGFANGEELPRMALKKATDGDSQGEENPLQEAVSAIPSAVGAAVQVLPLLASDKEAAITKTRKAKRTNFPHPEIAPGVKKGDLSSSYSREFSGGFHDKHSFPPQDVKDYISKTTSFDAQPYHAMLDHAAEIDAGKWGPTPTLKSAAQQIKADFIAEHIAADFDEPYEAMSPKAKKAYDEREARLDKLRPKQAGVALDIDSIWEEITEDMGPAPLVDVEVPGDNTTQPEGSGGGRPNKKDVGKLPEAFKGDEPEDNKAMSDSEAEAQEDSMPEPKQEHDESKSDKPWHVSSAMEDFVKEAYDELESDTPKFGCDQCEMLMINGIPCHELGCPNEKKTWVPERGWVRYNECPQCGSDVEEGEFCDCQEPFEEEASDKTASKLKKAVTQRDEKIEDADYEVTAQPQPLEDRLRQQQEHEMEMAASSKTADIADNAAAVDKAAEPSDKETGESPVVQSHKKYDEQQSKGAAEKTADASKCRSCGKKGGGYTYGVCDKCAKEAIETKLKKKADTADNPYNWVDGNGAPEDKKNAEKADTSGPDAKSASKKRADGIEKDLAKAKAESVSPYSTNSNTKPETTSAEEMRNKNAAIPTPKPKKPADNVGPSDGPTGQKMANPVQPDAKSKKGADLAVDWKGQFDQTLSVGIKPGDRVCHRITKKEGVCVGIATISGTVKVPAVTVRYDDGTEAVQVPAEEFTKVRKAVPPQRPSMVMPNVPGKPWTLVMAPKAGGEPVLTSHESREDAFAAAQEARSSGLYHSVKVVPPEKFAAAEDDSYKYDPRMEIMRKPIAEDPHKESEPSPYGGPDPELELEKTANPVQPDVAEAKAETVSPDTTNSNTAPETTPAEDLRSKTAEVAEPTSGEDKGFYVNVTYSKGGITLKPTKKISEAEANIGKDRLSIWALMEDFFANGWETVNPEDIGALTSGEIFSDPDGNIYWHERYQIEDMVEELMSGESVWMQYGGNLYEDGDEASKTSADVSGDVAEAKSETVSPDTVDADIHQETKSVPEAAKVGAEDYDTLYPNDPPGYHKRVLELEAEGLTTSDAQAVADAEFQKKLGADVSGDVAEAKSEIESPDTVDPSIKQETKSVPEAAKVAAEPSPLSMGETSCVYCGRPVIIGLESPGVSNHLTENGEIDYDADADHVAVADEGYGEIPKRASGDIPVAQGETESGKQPVSDLGGGAPEAMDVPAVLASNKEAAGIFDGHKNPEVGEERALEGECPHCSSRDTETFEVAEGKKMFCHDCNQIVWHFPLQVGEGPMREKNRQFFAAAGDNLPEEIPIDSGAGDLADVVMSEEDEELEPKKAAFNPHTGDPARPEAFDHKQKLCNRCHKKPAMESYATCKECHEDSLTEAERATGVQ